MIDCGGFFNFFTWTLERGIDVSLHSVGDTDRYLSNINILYQCDISANDFLFETLVEAKQ